MSDIDHARQMFEYFEAGINRAETIDRVSRFVEYIEQMIANAES